MTSFPPVECWRTVELSDIEAVEGPDLGALAPLPPAQRDESWNAEYLKGVAECEMRARQRERDPEAFPMTVVVPSKPEPEPVSEAEVQEGVRLRAQQTRELAPPDRRLDPVGHYRFYNRTTPEPTADRPAHRSLEATLWDVRGFEASPYIDMLAAKMRALWRYEVAFMARAAPQLSDSSSQMLPTATGRRLVLSWLPRALDELEEELQTLREAAAVADIDPLAASDVFWEQKAERRARMETDGLPTYDWDTAESRERAARIAAAFDAEMAATLGGPIL